MEQLRLLEFEVTVRVELDEVLCDELVTLMADRPHDPLPEAVRDLGLDHDPAGWQERVRELAGTARPRHSDGTLGQRFRFVLGLVMRELRGRVPAREVAAVVAAALEVTP